MTAAGMYPDAPRVAVGALIIHQQQVLLVQRGRAPNFGAWTLPGGRVRLGETLQQAVEREVWEETGVRVRAHDKVHSFELIDRDAHGAVRHHYLIVDLRAEYIDGTPHAGDDAVAVRWIATAALGGLAVEEQTAALLRRCTQRDLPPTPWTGNTIGLHSSVEPVVQQDNHMVMERHGSRHKSGIGKPVLAGDIPLLHERPVECPYCGETFFVQIDGSAGSQSYFEDCEVCCRPILLRSEIDSDGNLLGLSAAREDD